MAVEEVPLVEATGDELEVDVADDGFLEAEKLEDMAGLPNDNPRSCAILWALLSLASRHGKLIAGLEP